MRDNKARYARLFLVAAWAAMAGCSDQRNMPECSSVYESRLDKSGYEILDDGIALHKETGLKVTQCAVGQRMSNYRCRGESLKLREVDYVQAAVSLGVRHSTLIGRHILPNVLHIVLITVVLDFSGLVLAEAVLSYVNIGVDPTMNSWGNMINSARLELAREPVVWWSLTCAFLFMFTLVLAANLFADVVRDAFDPRLRSER